MHTVLKLTTVGFAFTDIVLLIFGLNYKWRWSVHEKFDIADVCSHFLLYTITAFVSDLEV